MKQGTRRSWLFMASLALALVVSACSSGGGGAGKAADSGSGGGSPAKSAGPVQINIVAELFLPQPPGDDNVVKQEIEKESNTKLNITWVSSNNYNDKLNVTLASGDIPELTFIPDPTSPQVQTIADQGAFWDLTPYVKNYKNLNAIPKDSWDNSSINGKYYGIPRYRPLIGGGALPLVRKDWLDQLELKVPATMDDLYNAMKAFTERDPDGDGKKDTVGFTGYVGVDNMGQFGWVENVFNGATGNWKLKDGKLINMTLEPGTRDALVWLNKAFQEGIISPDFPTLKNTQVREMITSNKAGMFADAMNPSWLLTGQMRKTNPKADLLPLTYLEGPFGKFVPKDSGFFGMYAIPKKVPEAKMKQILQFMDFGASEQGWMLGNYGLKDRDYTMKDGVITTTPQATGDLASAFGQLFSNMDKYARAYQVGIPADFLNRNKKIIDERAKYAIPDPSIGIISPTYLKVGKDYDKKIQDLKTKVIMGREPISSWDAYVTQLKNDPQYQKIAQEMNDLYKKKNAK